MHRPFVTIAIPTYNRADYFLPRCLQSAVRQDYEHLEIIVCDNCSEDRTTEVVNSFDHPHLRYVRHETNLGAFRNFQACLDAARGDYFLLLQDDDVLDPDFVSTCMEAAGYRTSVAFVRTGTRIIDYAGNVVNEKANRGQSTSGTECLQDWFRGRSAWYLCSTLFNTEKLRSIGGFTSENKLAIDGVVFSKMALHFEGVNVREIKTGFRKHDQEITSTVDIRRWTDEYALLLASLEHMLPPREESSILNEAEHHFSTITYRLANNISSPLKRHWAYWSIFRTFGYRHPPPQISQVFKSIVPSSTSLLLKQVYRGLHPN